MPETITAERIELRRLRPQHLPALMDAIARSQPELARWLPWADPMPTEEDERQFILAMEVAFDADERYGYVLVNRSTDELVGGIGLHPNEVGIAEIGYWVHSDHTRRGYATAAADVLTESIFDHLADVRKVIIRMDSANLASAAVPPKLGYVFEGEEAPRQILTSGHTGRGWIWARQRTAT
jgi:RimJ/RimL family protein N-acetyltransferase